MTTNRLSQGSVIVVEKYDLIVIGTGAGMNVAAPVVEHGYRVAVVDRDPLGGTCLNRGCIPSKVWTSAADAIREAEAAATIGVGFSAPSVDYVKIRQRTWEIVLDGRQSMEAGVGATENLDFYNDRATFVSDMTLEVGGKRITGTNIVIASGARPLIPPIEGLDRVSYLTNRNIFELELLPRSVVVVGGGYIACELAHALSAMGTEVTIVGRNERLLPKEDPEISDTVKEVMSRYIKVLTHVEARSVSRSEGGIHLVGQDREMGIEVGVEAEALVIASGRISNADLLRPWVTGVDVDDRGWIKTNEFLETTRPDIWALGDCVNRGQYRHTANYHSGIVIGNAFAGRHDAVEERAIPSAVFTWPQVGSVGLTEDQAIAAGFHTHVGRARYVDTAKGFAIGDEDGFAKVVVDAETGRILGASIVGPQASVLIQLVVDLMNAGDGTVAPLDDIQVIHPALSEVVIRAFGALEHAGGGHDHEHHHHHHE